MDDGAGGNEGERAVALVVWFPDGARKAKKKKERNRKRNQDFELSSVLQLV